MTWLISTALSNTLLAVLMAAAALALGRGLRRPAVTHVLWILVLAKLVTPPLVPVRLPILLGWTLPAVADEPAIVLDAPESLRAPEAPSASPPDVIAMATVEMPAAIPTGESTPSTARDLIPTRSPQEMPDHATVAVAKVRATVPSTKPSPKNAVHKAAKLDWSSLARFMTAAWIIRAFAVIWLTGSVGILLVVAWRVVRFSRLLAERTPAPAELRQEMLELSRTMGLVRGPSLELISGPISPMLWWLGGQSRILFPAKLIATLSAAERKTLLVHELAHFARGDHWVRLLELLTAVVYWWNPVAWLARRQLHLAEEACCDAWVVAELPESRPIYARALVHTIGFLSERAGQLPVGASGLGYFKVVEGRVRAIMTGRASRGLSGLAKVGLAIAALVLLPLLPRLHGEEPPSVPSGDSKQAEPSKTNVPAKTDAPSAATNAPTTGLPTTPQASDPKEFETASRALVGGRGGVRSVAISPDGKFAASSTGDFNQPAELSVWDVEKRTKRLTIPQTIGYRTIAFTPDGSKILAGNFDGRLTVIDSATAQWFDVQSIHRRGIMSLDVTRDGAMLVTGSHDSTIKLWKLAKLVQGKPAPDKPVDGALIRTLVGSPHGVFAVCISPDEKLVASGSEDRTIRIWDIQSGGINRTIPSPAQNDGGVIEAMKFSPDGKMLAAAYGDGLVRLWKIADGELAAEFPHVDRREAGFDNRAVSGLAFQHDGKTLITVGFDHQIKIWDVAQKELLDTIPAHDDQITDLALASDDRQMATSSRDGRVKFWDIDSRRETAQLGNDETGRDQPEPIVAAAWSSDGRWIASAHEDRTVRIRDAAEGKVLAIINGHDDVIAAVAFAPGGLVLATASYDRTVKLWDLSPLAATRKDEAAESSREAGEIKLPLLKTCRGHGNWVMSAAFSSDGKWLLTGSYDRTARLWSVAAGAQAALISGHTAAVRSVAFAPDGQQVATGSSDRTARLWSVEAIPDHSSELRVVGRALLGEHTGAWRAVAFSPDGKTLATGSEDKTIKLWNVAAFSSAAAPAGEELAKPKSRATLNGHEQMVWCLAFSPHGRTLVSGGLDSTLRVWDPVSGRQRQLIRGHGDAITSLVFAPNASAVLSTSLDRSLRVWHGRSAGLPPVAALNLGDSVRFVGITDDSQAMVAGAYNAQLKVWDLSTGKVTEGRQPRSLTCGALARDSRHLATGGLNGDIYLWTLQPLAIIATLKNSATQVQSLAFSPNGKQLAAGDYDGVIRLWNLDSRKVDQEFAKQELAVEGLNFSPDGSLLASATGKFKEWQRQGTVKLWDPATGRELTSLAGPKRKMRQALFTDNGQLLVASGSQTDVLVYDVASRTLKKQFETGTENSSLALLPDNKTLAIGGLDGSVRLWSLETGLKLREYEGHRDGKSTFVFSAARSPDGSLVVSGGADNYLRVYDTSAVDLSPGERSSQLAARVARLTFPAAAPNDETFEIVKTKQVQAHGKQLWFIVYSPDGKQFATGGFDKTIKLWNAATFEPVTTMAGHNADAMHAAYSPDGRLLASASSDRTVRLWDIAESRQIAVFDGHQQAVRNVAFSPSGKWLASASEDGTVRIWDVGSHSVLRVLNVGSSALSVTFLGSDKRLAVGSGNPRVNQDGDLSLWNAETGELMERLPSTAGRVTHLQSLDSGESVLAANAGAGVAIRNVTTGQEEKTFRAPVDVRWAEMSRDRRFVLGTHGYETYNVTVWRRESGTELITFPVANVFLFAAAFSPDGRYILTGTADATLTVWELKQTGQATSSTAKK